MDVIEALKQRKSVRAYLDKEVTKELIEQILESAKYAPSGVNMQPFDVVVVSGDTKTLIENEMISAFDNNQKESMDYQYYPQEWIEPYKSRRKETGLLMYETLEITREDKQRQIEQWKANYKAFGAPVVVYFFLDPSLKEGSFLDYGMFLQSFMLAATSLGLATCPMASLAEFPSIVKKHLKKENKKLLCGIALGHEDKGAVINSYRTPRIKLQEFTSFYQ